ERLRILAPRSRSHPRFPRAAEDAQQWIYERAYFPISLSLPRPKPGAQATQCTTGAYLAQGCPAPTSAADELPQTRCDHAPDPAVPYRQPEAEGRPAGFLVRRSYRAG